MATHVNNKVFVEVYGQPREEKDLKSLYSNYNINEFGTVDAVELQVIYERLRNCTLSLPQIEASIRHVCSGYPQFVECDEEEFLDVLCEMDRRSFLAQDLQWEFAMLDRYGKGSITIEDAMFLFKMVHGEFFSKDRFDYLINARLSKECDITFQEIEVELCDIPTYQWIKDQKAADKKVKAIELEKKQQEERDRMAKKMREEEEVLAKQAEIERLQREEEMRKAEERKKAEELRKAEEEHRKLNEEERVKREEEEKSKHDEEKRIQEEKLRRQEEERRKFEEEQRLKLEEEERLKQEGDKLKLEEEERIKREEEERLKREEEERLKREEEERLKREEEERLKREEEEKGKQKSSERARENWKKLKNLGDRDSLPDDLKSLRKMKRSRSLEEVLAEENNVDAIAKAEENAEEELLRAEELLKNAASEEERQKAKEAKEKAEADALLNKEKRLRLQLKTAVKLKNRPKLDVSIDEAKESKIEALKPDIGKAELVSDSLKCGEDLEDAMVKRDLPLIEKAVENIKNKNIENQHVVQVLAAEKLMDKLRRLEKAKKDILELNQRTIAIIRSYSQPIPAIREVMVATFLILGESEKELKEWKYIQALLGRTGKKGLKRMCTTLEASTVDLNIAKNVEKKYLNNHTLESITDISAGIGTFYAWSTNIIEEARNWAEDSEFRKKIEEKRKMEQEETQKLQDARKKKAVASKAAVSKPSGKSAEKTKGTKKK